MRPTLLWCAPSFPLGLCSPIDLLNELLVLRRVRSQQIDVFLGALDELHGALLAVAEDERHDCSRESDDDGVVGR